MPERILLEVFAKLILTKYCPPVFFAETLTSATFPLMVVLFDFTKTVTGIPFEMLLISLSATIAVTCKREAPSTLTKGIPGLAISPSFTNVLVTSPENGAVILE